MDATPIQEYLTPREEWECLHGAEVLPDREIMAEELIQDEFSVVRGSTIHLLAVNVIRLYV